MCSSRLNCLSSLVLAIKGGEESFEEGGQGRKGEERREGKRQGKEGTKGVGVDASLCI